MTFGKFLPYDVDSRGSLSISNLEATWIRSATGDMPKTTCEWCGWCCNVTRTNICCQGIPGEAKNSPVTYIHNGTPYNQTKTLWILYPEDRKCEKYRSKGYIEAAHELQQSPKNMWNLSRKRTSSSCLSRCGSRRVEVEDLKSSWDETLYIDSEDIRHRWKARWFRGGDQQAIQLLCLQESDETGKHSEVAPLPEKTMEDNLFKVRNEWPIIELLRFDAL